MSRRVLSFHLRKLGAHCRLLCSSPPCFPSTNPNGLLCDTPMLNEDDDDEDEEEEEDGICLDNRAYWTQKIRAICADESNVDSALALLDRLHLRGYRPDPLDLASVVFSLCRASRFSEAHRRLLLSPSVPDHSTANLLLSHLLRAYTPGFTSLVLGHLLSLDSTFTPSITIYNRLIHQFSFLSHPSDACKMFDDMQALGLSPNVVSYTSLIDGYCKTGNLGPARKLFDEMMSRGVSPNSLTYSILLKGVLRKRQFDEGMKLMGEMWRRMHVEEDLSINTAAFANLVDALCREGLFHEVFKIAETMPQGKSVCEQFAYGQMIDSLCRSGKSHGASRIVYIMRKRGFTPSLVSYNSIIHGLTKQGEGGSLRAFQLFEEGIEFGYSPPEATYKALIEGLCLCSHVEKAKILVHFMLQQENINKLRIYNIFMGALCLIDNPPDLLNLLVEMLQNNCQPDVITLNTLLHGLCKTGSTDEALRVLNDMLTGNFSVPDMISFTTVISGLLDVGRTEEALDLLHHKMKESCCSPNVVTYNVILRGFSKLQMIDKALEEFNDMASKGICADCATYSVIIDGLCSAYRIDEMKRFWQDVVWPSKVHDDFVYAAILRGLCNAGKLNEACDFLFELVDCGVSPKIVNYNILIHKAYKLGLKREAYQVVREMRKNGLVPDAVTWRILNKLHVHLRKQDGATAGVLDFTRDKKLLDAAVSEEEKGGSFLYKEKENRLMREETNDSVRGTHDMSLREEGEDQWIEKIAEAPYRGIGEPSLAIEREKGDDTCGNNLANDAKTCAQPRQKEPLSKIARRVFGLV